MVDPDSGKITVYYDGACPGCVKDRARYEHLEGKDGPKVCWFDITDKESELWQLGIDPSKALRELHIKDEQQVIRSEIAAYLILMQKIPRLKPLAWLIALPGVRQLTSALYRRGIDRRLQREGRFPETL